MAGFARALLLGWLLPGTAFAAAEPPPEGAEARPVFPIRERPEAAVLRACSFQEPLCVHSEAEVDRRRILPVLAAAERALSGLRALGVEAPRDGGLGGSQAFDVYLTAGGEGPAAWPDARLSSGGLDSVSAFGLVPATALGGCSLDAEIARVAAQASLLRIDAAMHEGLLALQASHLASLVAPCLPLEAAAVDRFQRTPEQALSRGDRRRFDGAMLFSAYLDERRGRGRPGAVMNSVLSLAVQRTPAEATHWENEPDAFDLLRRLMPGAGQSFGELLLDFSVARAFVGNRSDGVHLSDSERFGAFGRVRFDWSVPYRSLPRRLAPRAPVEATGASYLWIDAEGVSPERGLLVALEWETTFVFHVSVVRVDAEGREIGRHDGGGVFGHHQAQITLERLDGAAGLVVVATNLGHDDRSHPFDPDRGPPRASAYEITLHPR